MSIWDDDHTPYGTGEPGTATDWKAAYDKVMSEEEADEVLGEQDPHAVLSIRRGSTKAQVKAAYRKLAKNCSDAFGTSPDEAAVEKFKKAHAAYSKLMV